MLGWALIVPFLLLSLVSASVMPLRQADGSMTLVLCGGDGPIEVTVDAAQSPHHAPAPEPHKPCPWACGHAVADMPLPVPMPVIVGSVTRMDPPPRGVRLAAAGRTGLPPSTGPPSA